MSAAHILGLPLEELLLPLSGGGALWLLVRTALGARLRTLRGAATDPIEGSVR